jgi:hypothetical protein
MNDVIVIAARHDTNVFLVCLLDSAQDEMTSYVFKFIPAQSNNELATKCSVGLE